MTKKCYKKGFPTTYTIFPFEEYRVSLCFLQPFSIDIAGKTYGHPLKPCKHLQCGFPIYECTGHPNYDRKQGFLPFTLVLGTLIDKSWLIYLALYIGEERNRKEKKEKKQKMGCFLYLINWLTQTEKKIHFTPWGDFSFSAVIHMSLIMKK